MLTIRRTREDGAIAVMTAILMVVLMGAGALAVDLGNAWARKRAIQNSADLAALAGAQSLPDIAAARAAAKDYITRNVINGQGLSGLPSNWDSNDPVPTTDAQLKDVGRTDGEIEFFLDANGDGQPQASELVTSGSADMIRVVPPPATVPFGLARVIGATSERVQLPATARIGTALGLGIPPFFLTSTDSGAVCIQDSPSGGPGLSALPSALLARPAGIVLSTISPNTAAAGQTVVLTGTSFPTGNPTVLFGTVNATVVTHSSTQISVIVPAQTSSPPPATVQVTVKSGASVSNSVTFTYAGAGTDPCAATSSNRGFLDEPRFTTGSAQAIELNIKHGIDHNAHDYTLWPSRGTVPPPAPGTQCDSLTNVYESGGNVPLPDINCVNWQSGTASGQMQPGFFDTSTSSPGRLYQLCNTNTTSSGRYSNIDGNAVWDFAKVGISTTTLKAAILAGGPAPTSPTDLVASLTPNILKCPRFAILPVVNPAIPSPNGSVYYPVVGFKAVYFDDETADRGFIWQGNSLQGIRGYVIDSTFLPPVVSSLYSGKVGPYLGSGLPVVPVLTRDPADRPS